MSNFREGEAPSPPAMKAERDRHPRGWLTVALALSLVSFAAFGEETDPTRPPVAVQEEVGAGDEKDVDPSSWRLQATFLSPTGHRAVIDGQIVGEGEMIEGVEVVEVLPGTVTLRGGAETWTLSVFVGFVSDQPDASHDSAQ